MNTTKDSARNPNPEVFHKVRHAHMKRHFEFWRTVYDQIVMNEANPVPGHMPKRADSLESRKG